MSRADLPQNFALYEAAIVADDAYSDELKRVYGRATASDMRYKPHLHTDAKLIAAHKVKLAADEVWRACMVKMAQQYETWRQGMGKIAQEDKT